MSSLKQKAIRGILWSAVDSFSSQGVHFIVGIVLARLVEPREFGLFGMISIFIAISQTFIDSGFTNALIRKKDCSQADYSTVFFYNITAGFLLYLLIFFSAGAICKFYNEPQLLWLIRASGLTLIISSLTLIQRTRLTKNIDFRLQTKITIISGFLSGLIGIAMAYLGFGVWSLVIRTVSAAFIASVLLWIWNRWMPTLVFSMKSFRELFGFGSRLLASGLIDTTYRNIYSLIIGKYFSASELGFYTRASMFNDLPSAQMTNIIGRVSYPVLAEIQDDKVKLKEAYKQMIKTTMFISLILMAGLAASAEPLIISLIGEKWRQSIIYLQLLCFVGAMYPFHALNLNMLNVQGRSDLFLKLEIIKKIIAIPTIIIGIFFGVKMMICGMWVNSLLAYYLNSYYSGRLLNYSMKEQLIDIMPSVFIAVLMGTVLYSSNFILPFNNAIKLIVQSTSGALIVILSSELVKLEPYHFLKNIINAKLKSFNNA